MTPPTVRLPSMAKQTKVETLFRLKANFNSRCFFLQSQTGLLEILVTWRWNIQLLDHSWIIHGADFCSLWAPWLSLRALTLGVCLRPLFVLSGGGRGGSQLHLCGTIEACLEVEVLLKVCSSFPLLCWYTTLNYFWTSLSPVMQQLRCHSSVCLPTCEVLHCTSSGTQHCKKKKK